MIKKQIHTLLKETSLFLLLIAPWTISAQVPNYVPTNGLVGWWPFNGNANDESGNGNNGTPSNIIYSTDRFGNISNSANFPNGNNDSEIIIGNQINPNVLTISVWIKASGQRSNGFHTVISRVNQYDPIPPNNFELQVSTPDPTYSIWTGFGGNNQFQPTSGLGFGSGSANLNMWNHLVLTFDGQEGKTYLNGTLISINSIINYFNPTSILCFGNRYNAPSYEFNWWGDIDDTGIWNRVLSQCEIQDLYNGQLNSVSVNAGIDQTICNGEQVTLSAANSQNYSWNNNVLNGISFTPTASQDYIVSADSAGCLSNDTVTITVIQPSISSQTQTALDSLTLNGQTYTQSGTYTQVIPNAAGCDSTITLNLSLSFTGLNELQTGFTVAPNPTMDVVTITSTDALYDEYVLFDPQGRKVLSGTLTGTTTQLDLSRLARGNYLLQIGEKKTPIKLIKQ
jgi:hypothetical protein